MMPEVARATTPSAAARPAGIEEERLPPRLAVLSALRLLVSRMKPEVGTAAAKMSAAEMLQAVVMQAVREAEEQQAGPVGPAALSCPPRTGLWPAA